MPNIQHFQSLSVVQDGEYNLMTNVLRSFETSVTVHQPIRRNIPEKLKLQFIFRLHYREEITMKRSALDCSAI